MVKSSLRIPVRRRSFIQLGFLLVALVMILAGTLRSTVTAAAPLPAGTYCGDTAPTDGSYHGPTKIIVIEGENEPYHAALDPAQAPFQANTLNSQCGYMSNMHNETHGSEANYHALVSGQYANWALCDFPPDDNGAHSCANGPVTDYGNTPSIMSQVEATSSANNWKIYAENMAHLSGGTTGTLVPTNCQKFDGPASSPYAVRHNPGPYFPNISCATQDVPYTNIDADITNGQLPQFGMIIPDNNDNGHDTGIGTYDSFVGSSLAKLQASPDYQSGNLAVVVTYDEGTAHGTDNGTVGEDCTNPSQGNTMGSCQIDSWVVARYVPHTTWNQFATHYSILKSAESMIGLPYLGHAADANTVDFYKDTNPFNLNPSTTPPVITAPGAPTNVTATAGDGIASVSFIPPTSNGGAPITNYTVTSSPGNVTSTGNSSPLTISGLTNGTPYTFTVTATNSAGTSSASLQSNAITPMAATQTNLLTNGGFESSIAAIHPYATGSTLAQVTAPVHGGTEALEVGSTGGVTAGFNAATIPGSLTTAGDSLTAGCWAYATGNSYSAHIRLSEGTAYTKLADVTSAPLPLHTWTLISAPATVQNTNDQLILSGYTNNQTGTTGIVWDDCFVNKGTSTPPTITAPGAPTNTSATASNGAATVSFTPPTSNGGAPITNYTVTSNPGNLTASGNTSPINISGLTNGTSYTFTVTATNSAGTSAPSMQSNSITPMATVPTMPTNLTASAGNSKVTLSWATPTSNGGAPITDYLIEYKPSASSTWTTFADGVSTATTGIVTSLTNGTSYDFRVSATNSVGQGSASTPTSATPIFASSNLLTNGDFETITPANGMTAAYPTGVKVYAASSTLMTVTSIVHSGTHALQISNTSTVTAGFNAPPISGSSIVAGKTLSAQCWVYAPSANFKAHLRMSEGNSYTGIADITSATLVPNTWTLLTAAAPAQKTGDQIILSGYTNNQTTGAPGLIWDDCSLTSN